MRLIGTTFTIITLATFAVAVQADDVPDRPAELQVLDRFAGTWKTVVTTKTSGQTSTSVDFVTRVWSDDGKGLFLVESAKPKLDDPVSHSQGAWTYDPTGKVYRLTLMMREWTLMSTATWDDKTRTMTFRHTNSSGHTGSSVHRFIDKDRAEWSAVVKNDEGKVVMEMSAKQTRVIGDAAKSK
jgi:hypothetical protein